MIKWIPPIGLVLLCLAIYTCVGTGTRVEQIKKMAPEGMKERNWEILRYEGYHYGAWSRHGGKVWYHVKNIDNGNIQYRVYITLWEGELHYHYGAPETLNRLEVSYD